MRYAPAQVRKKRNLEPGDHTSLKRGCVKMYVNMHFDALSLFNEKGPVLSQARAFVVT